MNTENDSRREVDPIFDHFLRTQHEEGHRLAEASDLLELMPLDDQRFIATFSCRGLVRDANGEVREHDRFAVGIRFAEQHLRHVEIGEALTWLAPREIFHPNVKPPFICVGPIAAGTGLVELIYRCFEVITLQNLSMDERNALDREACSWARRHRDRFPVDDRPLKRRVAPVDAASFTVQP